MAFTTKIPYPTPQIMMDRLNAGVLPERIARILIDSCHKGHTLDAEDAIRTIDKEVGAFDFAYYPKDREHIYITHRKPADESTLMLITMFLHRKAWTTIVKDVTRCAVCGEWFMDTLQRNGVCGKACARKRSDMEERGVIVRGFARKPIRKQKRKRFR